MLDTDTIKVRLQEWLPSHLGAGPVTVTEVAPPIGNGYSSVTLLFTAEWQKEGAQQQRKLVARLEPDRPGVFPEYDVELQFEIMTTLHERTSIPVPIPLWQERDPAVLGAPFFIMSHLDGRVPSDNPPYTLEGWILDEPPVRQRTLYMSGLEQMARIHTLDAESLFGRLEPRLRVGLDEELAYYERFFEWAAAGRPQPVAEKTWQWLQDNRPKGWIPKGISWGDSRISNMIFGADLRPVAVLDWEMFSLNDPEMDLGWWLFLDRHFTTGMGVENPPGFPTRAETIKRWEEITSQPADKLEYWELYAGFRFAVMMRIAQLVIDDGLMPPDSDFERNNTVTQILAGMLGLPHPSELDEMASASWGLSALSPLDDFPYHQISEPMRHVGTSDRNFYDRYYFNCHPGSDDVFLITGMGQYPNLGVADAFAVVLHDDKHRVVRASRELGSDRSDTSVGPFHIEVIEGLRRLHVWLEPNEWDVSFDLTWDGAVPAFLEPRHFDRQFGRVTFDSTRFAQVGCWTGSIEVVETTFKVTPDRWQGSRDRSWGVRPVGEGEPPGIAAHKPNAGFFWIYAPMQFDDHALLVLAEERADGTRVFEEGVRVWSDPSRAEPELLGRIEHELVYEPGTRRVRQATLRMTEPDGSPLAIDIDVLLPLHVGVGTGYGLDADWRHGMYQGPLVVQGLVHDLSTDDGRAAMWGIVDAVARFEVTEGSTAGAVGFGMFEHMNLGPYTRYGFNDFLDGAP